MTNEVRTLMNAEPFVPFVIRTADERRYRVKHPDYVAISPKGGRITVYANEETGTMLSALHVVSVEELSTRSRSR